MYLVKEIVYYIMAATQESSVALSQQSIFDWVSGCTTRSMANNRDLPERKPDQLSKKQKRANQKKNQRKNRQSQNPFGLNTILENR